MGDRTPVAVHTYNRSWGRSEGLPEGYRKLRSVGAEKIAEEATD